MNTQAHTAQFDALRQFRTDRANDIFVRLDNDGFILEASDNADQLGIDLQAQLVMPNVADFADPEHRTRVAEYFVQVIAGSDDADGIEFTLANRLTDVEGAEDATADPDFNPALKAKRYSLHISCIKAEQGISLGAIGTLRPIGQESMSGPGTIDVKNDPFTGLVDRRCFANRLSTMVAMNEPASIAIFGIDAMRALFMQYGQSTADEIRWGFARFLEAMVEPDYYLGQLDDERFGVILPFVRPKDAREWARHTLQTFSGLASTSKGCKPQLSASAGIARAQLSAEWTIRQGELGLMMARSAGGLQTAICRPHSGLANGRSIEEAMDTVVEWTASSAAR